MSCPQRHSNADPEARRPSEASGGGSEESGSSTSKEGRTKKRIKSILEKWPPGPTDRTRVLEGKARTPGKGKGPRQQRGLQDIRQWFEQGGKPSQTTLESKKAGGSKEPQQKKDSE